MTTGKLEKVEALAAAAGTPGEREAALAAAARIRAKTLPEPYSAPSVESEVLAVLCNLGYRLIPQAESRCHGRLNATYLESTDAVVGLVNHLQSVTALGKLNSPDAHAWFTRLIAGRRIQQPEQHPSGIRCTAAPYEPVQQMGSGMHTAARSRP